FVQGCDGWRGITQLREQRMAKRRRIDLAIEALHQEACGAAGNIHVLANQITVDACYEVIEVEVDVFHAGVKLGSEVITQPFRIQSAVDIALRGDEGTA